MSKIQTSDAITKNAFVGFVIAIFVFFFMNVSIDWNDWWHSSALKFALYVLLMAFLVIVEIPRPGIAAFLTDVFGALNDGRLTPEEKLQLIQSAKDNLFGQWAELSAIVAQKEEKIEPPEPL